MPQPDLIKLTTVIVTALTICSCRRHLPFKGILRIHYFYFVVKLPLGTNAVVFFPSDLDRSCDHSTGRSRNLRHKPIVYLPMTHITGERWQPATQAYMEQEAF